MSVLRRLPWGREARRRRRFMRVAQQARGMRYCWPPHPWKDCMDCSGYLPPPQAIVRGGDRRRAG